MSKLCLGLYDPHPEFAAEANAVGGRSVLLFFRALSLAERIAPDTEIIGRDFRSIEQQDEILLAAGDNIDDLRAAGFVWAESLCQMFPRVQVWQALNEVMRKCSVDWLRRQVAFEIGFLDGLLPGRYGCVLNAPPGVVPTMDAGDSPEQREFFPVFAALVKPLLEHPKCKYLGWHAYSSHKTAHLWDDPDWYALRHRKVVSALRAEGVRVPPIAITELGWAEGWKAAGLQDHQAADELRWSGDQIKDDPDVHATYVFCSGNSGGWQDHDVHATGIISGMAEWNAANPVTETAPANGGGDMQVTEMEAKINQLLDQNRIITQALIDFRHGRFTGADGIDGRIVELLGGKLPEGWNPTYPKA